MSHQMTEEEIYRIAQRKVEKKKAVQTHFIVYIILNMFLSLIWALPFGWQGFLFFHAILAGLWGIGVIAHFLIVYLSGDDIKWDREAVEREVERLRDRASEGKNL